MTRKRTTTSRVASSRVDDLKIIRGIGPLYEKRLHDAGVQTFAQLAKLSPEDAATLIPNLSASQIRKQSWILQARKLAAKKTGSKSRRKKPAASTTSQHYENFTLEFLLTEKNKLRRLRIVHVQSGDVETWANWRQEEVSHFLARHTGTRIPEGKPQKLEGTTAKPKPTVKGTKPVKSANAKARHRSSTKNSVKPNIADRPRKTPWKPEAVAVRKEKKGQARSTKPEAKRSSIAAPKSDTPIVKTPRTEISQKPETPSTSKVEQVRAKSIQPEAGQNERVAPILFKPAAEVIPKRFLQKSDMSPIPGDIKHQADSSQPEAPQPQSVRETISQMGAVRLLKWNNFMADSNQPVKSLPHDQTFDVKLTLDISSLPSTTTSQLDITGTLLAKKLGTHERRVIGETHAVLPFSPTINLRVGKLNLEQGLYRLEAQIKMNDSDMALLQGGLFQVY